MIIRKINFQKKSKELLKEIKEVLEDYKKQNIKVTLRQLYYQLVVKGIIPNDDKQYKKLSGLITNARYSGVIDWGVIEDRARLPKIPQTFRNIKHIIEAAAETYSLNRWKEQENYVEIWTEKDAISSVIYPTTKKYQVPMVVNRGYSSASSMYESAQRFLGQDKKQKVILYLGDHDPSGIDMDRDIKERLDEFGVNIKVIRIGLTFEQVQKYNPPKNPTKMKDVRSKDYIKKYGHSCWEVDALRTDVLLDLIEKNILKYLDLKKYRQFQEKEKEDIKRIWRLKNEL